MKKVKVSGFELAGLITLVVAVVATLFAVEVAAIYLLWNWLAEDLFGAPHISVWHAIGFAVVLAMVTSAIRSTRNGTTK